MCLNVGMDTTREQESVQVRREASSLELELQS